MNSPNQLSLFDPQSFATLATKRKTHIEVKFSTRMKKSWRYSISPTDDIVVEIPALLMDAPLEIKNAMLDWCELKKNQRRNNYKTKKQLEDKVWNYLHKSNAISQHRKIAYPDNLKAKGIIYDLHEVFDTVNSRFFDNRLESYLRWGATKSKTSYYATYIDNTGREFNLITIAGIYDSCNIPKFAIESLMYHEMLHIAIPVKNNNGRRVVHGIDFKTAERKNPDLDKWHDWEKRKLVNIMKNKKKIFQRFLF